MVCRWIRRVYDGIGFSRSLPLSLLSLLFVGAADMVSVVVRGVLIQIETPDEMRGRVNAVDMIFIGASNELGEFESGLAAQFLGTVPAVVLGGAGTVLVTLLWAYLFPQLRRADSLTRTSSDSTPDPATLASLRSGCECGREPHLIGEIAKPRPGKARRRSRMRYRKNGIRKW